MSRTLPEGWKLISLGSVLERVMQPVKVVSSNEYREIGIRSHGKGIFHKPLITGEQLGEKRVFHVVQDALVLNIVFAWEQAVAVTSDHEIGMIASHRFPMYRPIDGRCNVRFLLHFFKTARGKELLELASPGGAGRNKTLGQKEFERLKVPMPPASEQARIASILDAWDRAIELESQIQSARKIERQVSIEEVLSGKRRLPGFTKGWKNVCVKDVADIVVSNVDKKIDFDELPVSLCNYTDVYYNDFLDQTYSYSAGTATKEEIERYKVVPGDVLITKDSESACDIAVPVCILDAPNDLVCGYHLAIIRPKLGLVDSIFLSGAFSIGATKRHFQTHANGVTRFGLPTSAITDAPILLPDKKEQHAISKLLHSYSQIARLQAKNVELLRQEKRALMQQLLTGKRRVKLEDFVAEASAV